MKKKLNSNVEIYNYLNITNRKLGKMYKYTGTNCLPPDFDVNEKTLKERIVLNEMQNQNIFPPFANEEKKVIKNCIKNSLKNIKKFKKYAKNSAILQNFSLEFIKKLSLYLELRHELTHALLKDFESQDCDEIEIYREIFNLDPVFGPLTDSLFDSRPSFELLLTELEEKNQKSYQEKLQEIEKKKKKKTAQKIAENENLKTVQKTKKTSLSNAKKVEKTAKNTQKLQNLKDAEKVRTQKKETFSNKNSMTTNHKTK